MVSRLGPCLLAFAGLLASLPSGAQDPAADRVALGRAVYETRCGGCHYVRLHERARERSFCCGAGGARMWMEESIGNKVNDERSEQLLATGASRIATACPFCYIMIDDGVKAQGVEEDQVKVADIAMHLLEALENADAAANVPTV